MNIQVIAKHLNLAEKLITEVQVWARVLWVRLRGMRPRFVSKVALIMGFYLETSDHYLKGLSWLAGKKIESYELKQTPAASPFLPTERRYIIEDGRSWHYGEVMAARAEADRFECDRRKANQPAVKLSQQEIIERFIGFDVR